MLELEVLVSELGAVDRLATGAIAACKVAACASGSRQEVGGAGDTH